MSHSDTASLNTLRQSRFFYVAFDRGADRGVCMYKRKFQGGFLNITPQHISVHQNCHFPVETTYMANARLVTACASTH